MPTPAHLLLSAGGGAAAETWSDTFTRANGAIGDLETGQSWTQASGTFTVASNEMVTSSGVGASCVVDALADGTLLCDGYASNAVASSVMFRYTSTSNYLLVYHYQTTFTLYKVESGSASVVATVSTAPTASAFYTYKIILSGSSIKAYIDDVLKIDTTSTFNQTAVGVGMQAQSGTTCRWDNFSMEA